MLVQCACVLREWAHARVGTCKGPLSWRAMHVSVQHIVSEALGLGTSLDKPRRPPRLELLLEGKMTLMCVRPSPSLIPELGHSISTRVR